MGAVCSNNRMRVIPKGSKTTLGLRSGQTISSTSVLSHAMVRKNPNELPIINQLELQEEEVLKWDDPLRYLQVLLKQRYRIIKILKVTGSSITAEVAENNQSFIFKRAIYESFDIASNHISYLYNMGKLDIDGVLPFTSLVITLFEYQQIQLKPEKTLYAIDRIIPKQFTLLDSIAENKLQNTILSSLVVLESVAKALQDLHKNGFAYRFLRPDIIVSTDHKKFSLSNPSLHLNNTEKSLIKWFIQNPKDYYLYDSMIFGVLFAFGINYQLYKFEELLQKRSDEQLWKAVIEEYKECINRQFDNDVPQIILQLVEMIMTYQKYDLSKMSDIYLAIKSCRQKGQQTFFKNDSLGAYLQYHKDKTIPDISDWLYFTKNNQFHVYNISSNKFHYLKVYKKKQPFRILSNVAYHAYEDKFFFFSHDKSDILLKVYDEAHERLSISHRREVELFRHLKGLQNVQFEDPQLLWVPKKGSETDSYLFIFNQKQMQDPSTDDIYYDSFIIAFTEQQVVSNYDESVLDILQLEDDQYIDKVVVKIISGPKNFQWHREAFHVYDPHNQYVYCIPDYNNIFQNGIRYSYYNVRINKGHFKEGVLKFACASEEMFKQFCALSFKIRKIVFCVEVQHGVYIMKSSNNIFILDFNLKCFYSLASLTQLQSWEANQQSDPWRYVDIFETRNQPFELKCLEDQGRNYLFQNGNLHVIAKKDIETVHLIYDIIPQQACIVLLHCISLHSQQDLLMQIPKTLEQIVSSNQGEKVYSGKYIKTIRQYGCTKLIYQEDTQTYLTAENEDKQRFYLHAIQVPSVSEISNLFTAFNKKIKSDILLTPFQYFACQEDRAYAMYYVNEECVQTMETEIEGRKLKDQKFQAKELSLLIKIIFRALKQLKDNGLEHGNLSTNSLCYTKTGMIKLSGWYIANRKAHTNDLDDALKLVFCLATLKRFSEIENYDLADEALIQYDGLVEMFRNIQKFSVGYPYAQITNVALNTAKLLSAQKVDFNSFQSAAQAIIWVAYSHNYIVVTPITNMKEPRFLKLSLLKVNNTNFKISKYCSFTFNFIDTIYISAAFKEDIKTQQFYEVQFNQDLHQLIQLRRLQDIPEPILAPTLLYLDQKIYCIGGYELMDNGSKQITNKVFLYQFKTKSWRSMNPLPVSLYGATALFSLVQNKIFLFGGVSSEVDLTSDKLIYLSYDINRDHWEFNVDLSFKSPFRNSRFMKPMIDIVNQNNMFISYQKVEDQFQTQIFELTKGGVSLKFSIKDEKYTPRSDEARTLQDDLSMTVYRESLYILDEDGSNLNIFRLKDIFHPQHDQIPYTISENAVPLNQMDGI